MNGFDKIPIVKYLIEPFPFRIPWFPDQRPLSHEVDSFFYCVLMGQCSYIRVFALKPQIPCLNRHTSLLILSNTVSF